jgi:hypothetical protein
MTESAEVGTQGAQRREKTTQRCAEIRREEGKGLTQRERRVGKKERNGEGGEVWEEITFRRRNWTA